SFSMSIQAIIRMCEAGMETWMNHVEQRQRSNRTFGHVAGVEDQDLRLVLMRVQPLDDDEAFHEYRLAAEIEARLGLIYIVHSASRPGAVRQLVEELPSRLSGGGNTQHPELVVLDPGETRVDSREVRRAVIGHGAALHHGPAIQIDHVAHGPAGTD